MIRVIAAAAVLGALVGSIAIYSKTLADRQAGLPFGGHDRGTEAAIKPEAWPICTTMTSVAPDADWVQLDPDFKAGKKALVAGDWNRAIAAFELAALRDPLNADTQNYIGYAYRRLRQLGPAMGHYQQALMLNPRHRSAHEHLGEAYLMLGEPAKAEQLLTALGNLCLIPCEEYGDLKRILAAYKGQNGEIR
ncbi:tetratricopeptide repeat protein [Bradyrhizobium acaciae]|uniref:tetratricopeptide repeat protein n=1 Tax=Bradyrhizobium acaciae TaxID=2683706 RepID=UPI001E4FD1FE|nr:tetratricopeptide repeat protein [Bradyrhizobium acaciae]MCC8978288.1 tetratricopeptide repeat protein [Bradyrhizobium acaciae]